MRYGKLAAAFVLAISLAACEGGPKENIGTVVGAAGGGLLGSQFGHGSGRLAATAAGTLIGALAGRELGKSLDKADQAAAQKATDRAHTAPIGQQIAWSNPESGHSGTITPRREGTDSTGNYCREYQTTVTVGGKTEQAYGTACRQPDGSWKVVN